MARLTERITARSGFHRAINPATLGTSQLLWLVTAAMGWDATFYFPPGTKRTDAEHFLALIGYKRLPPDDISRELKATSFYFPSDSDPARLSAVTAQIYVNDDGKLVATSRTNIWCTYRDIELQNTMLRGLKKYFKGKFESNFGKNRYFKHSGPKRAGVEAACYVASFRFLNSIQFLIYLSNWVPDTAGQKSKRQKQYILMMHPAILTSNLGTIYLVSLIEEFFKSIFFETLRSSKDVVNLNRLKPVKSFLLDRAYQDEISLEQAVAESLSFQNSESIRRNFSGLPYVGFVDRYLSKTISLSSKIRRADALQTIFDRRHGIVHRAELDSNYLPDDLKKDIRFSERLVRSLYRGLTTANKWPYEDPR